MRRGIGYTWKELIKKLVLVTCIGVCLQCSSFLFAKASSDAVSDTFAAHRQYTDNPVQIVSICCGGHFKVFPMFLFSLANTYNITKESVARGDPLPLNVTIFMDGFCHRMLNDCLPKLQLEYFPFHIIHKQHHEHLSIENHENRRFFCSTYKMHLAFMSTFSHLEHVMFLDLDIAVKNRFDDLWLNATVAHKKPSKAIYAALEMSDRSSDGLKHFNVTNSWYNDRKKTHYFPPSGLNTGVMILNLPLLRKLNATATNMVAMNTQDTSLADQDYFNTWAYFHQDRIEVINCKYNVRKGSSCVHPVNGEYVDLFHNIELATIFHASGGYVLRGYGNTAILFNYRQQFGNACGFWV